MYVACRSIAAPAFGGAGISGRAGRCLVGEHQLWLGGAAIGLLRWITGSLGRWAGRSDRVVAPCYILSRNLAGRSGVGPGSRL